MTDNDDKSAYIFNTRIVADTFDDETVLINIERGLYFSMQGSAVDIWRAFETPQQWSAVVETLGADLGAEGREAITKTVQAMVEHGLLERVDTVRCDATRLYSLAAATYAAPVLSVFTDLAELIAIDPVHEVDEGAGWPVRPASFPHVA